MKMRLMLFLLAGIILLLPLTGNAGQSRFLDAALSFLEDGNPFIRRYNELNNTDIRSRFPLGCPYFWGGRHIKAILQPASPGSSSDYYHTDRLYLYGLDCVGFTRWINEKTGYEAHPKISDLLNRSMYKECIIRGAAYAAGEELSSLLRIGDLLAIQHTSGGFHIAMYCGTLADYGYTDESVPAELVPYLHYPLLIHCSGSSDYYERYKGYLEAGGQTEINPPYGGVIVSILDVPVSAAKASTPDVLDLRVPCFDLEGYHLQILDLSQEKQYRWIRWRHRPEPAAQ